jgi:transcriptional regulator with XRE-family HTH domain
MAVQVSAAVRQQWQGMRTRLLAARQASGVTQEEAASALGVVDRSLRDWERGYDTPSLPHLIGWAYYLSLRLVITGPGDDPIAPAARSQDGESFLAQELQRLVIPLWNRRRAARLSQTDLAVILGVSRSSVMRWESTAQTPMVFSLIAWADRLGCRITLAPEAAPGTRSPTGTPRKIAAVSRSFPTAAVDRP